MDKAIADKDVNQACALSYVRTPARVIVRAQTRRNRNISRLCAQVGAPTMPQMCVPRPAPSAAPGPCFDSGRPRITEPVIF